MARELERFHINRFRGLALAGDRARRPTNMYVVPIEWECWFAKADNVFAPNDTLTNDGIGYTAQAAAAAAAAPKLLESFSDSTANQHVVTIENGSFYDQGNLSATWVSKGSGLSTSAVWTSAVYNRRLFMGNGTDNLKRYDGTNFYNWLIAAPTAAPTLADGGAGSLSAGIYQYAYSFQRSADEWESPLSPIGSITLAASKQTSISAIQVSTDAQVDKVRIWRTTAGGATYRLLVTINTGTTTYADNIPDASLSLTTPVTLSALSSLNSASVTAVGDRLYLAGTVEGGVTYSGRVRWSYPGKPWIFDSLDFTDEIDDETVASSAGGRGVLVFTKRNAWEVRHRSGGVHVTTRTSLPGGFNSWGCCPIPGGVFWWDGTRVYATDDNFNLLPIGERVEPLTREIPAANKSQTWMRYVPKYGVIIFGGAFSAATPDKLLLFDLKNDAWWRLNFGAVYGCPASSSSGSLDKFIFGLSSGATKNGFTGVTADGASLLPDVEVGPTDFGLEYQKRFRYIDAHVDYSSALSVQARWGMNNGERTGSEVLTTEGGGAVLGAFILGTSLLSAAARQRLRADVGDTAEYITFGFKETSQTGPVGFAALDVIAQMVP